MSLKSYLVTVFAQPINNDGGCILVARFFFRLYIMDFYGLLLILYAALVNTT
jgi:hypothetical protein